MNADFLLLNSNKEFTDDIKNTAFLHFIRNCNHEIMKSLSEITDDEKFYNEEYIVPVDKFLPHIQEINLKVESGIDNLLSLALFFSEYYREKNEQYAKMSNDNKITFDHLTRIFEIGKDFVTKYNDEYVSGTISDTRIVSDMFGGKHLNITGSFIVSTGKHFILKDKTFSIPQFNGMRNRKDLSVLLLDECPEIKQSLIERGKTFKKYGLGSNYVQYDGNMYKMSMYGPVYFKAHGRCMIDVVGYNAMNPSRSGNYNCEYDNYKKDNNVCDADLPEEILHRTWPFLNGFSFNAKQWGEMFVKNMSDIKFDDNAFEYLVLPQEKKDLAKALILNVDKSFTDIISGKNGGCIFLLHGPPGTGKTLTCEAIAELLHKPLYSITVGELGTTPADLENKLVKILDIANSWSAVILIDEADIFLEKRTDNDINRNAMVGIFLRLLEKHQGVMFLTTNRKDSMDEAFRSRISVVFEYKELDNNMRYQIWKNLLSASNINLSNNDINHLVNYELNGRQIKNSIRMGQCLSLSRNESLNLDHLKIVIEHM